MVSNPYYPGRERRFTVGRKFTVKQLSEILTAFPPNLPVMLFIGHGMTRAFEIRCVENDPEPHVALFCVESE